MIRGCADRAEGTWLTADMIAAYEELASSWAGPTAWKFGTTDKLAGGIYGVAIDGFFAGESMFHRVRDASKVALAFLVDHLLIRGYQLFDTQMLTEHTQRLGAVEIPRQEYLGRLRAALLPNAPSWTMGQVSRGVMSYWYPNFPMRRLPTVIYMASLSALLTGIYGAVNDQISYIISPEYFSKVKFEQFAWADLGWPPRVFAALVGFLGSWWVGLIGGWLLARLGLAELVEVTPRNYFVRAYALALAIAMMCALGGVLCTRWSSTVPGWRGGKPGKNTCGWRICRLSSWWPICTGRAIWVACWV